MQILEPIPNVLHLLFNTRIELTLSMCRLQEFYESPFKNIKGCVFTLENFIEEYADEDGDVDYFSEWDGFNLPKIIIEDFFTKFQESDKLTKREKIIHDLWFTSNKNYKYLIATEKNSDKTTYAHELAHALWAVNPEYNKACQNIIDKKIPKDIVISLKKHLIENEYPDDPIILNDEIQAYLKTSNINELDEMFPSLKIEKLLDYQQMFENIKIK